MKNKTFDFRAALIGGLTVSAIALGLSLLSKPTSAVASEAVQSRDYQIVTARIQNGGDGVYILDNRTGLVAFMSWDPSQKGLSPRDVRSMDRLFTGQP